MRHRPLGRTGIYVSELCFGTMTFGGKGFWEAIGRLGAADAEAMVGTALDAGVNFVDTADVYSQGEAEVLLGRALAALGRPREQLVVATKVRGRTGPGPKRGRPLPRPTSWPRSTRASAGSASSTSTSTRSTVSTATRRSRRRSARSTMWCARERRATSGSATFPPGSG